MSKFPEFLRRATILTISGIFWIFLQVNPHYIWLFVRAFQYLSIPCNFVISNHENHIILLISKKVSKKILLKKKRFQIEFKSEIKYSSKFPEPETRGIGFSFPDPRGMTNCHSPIPRIPEEWKSPGNWHPYR